MTRTLIASVLLVSGLALVAPSAGASDSVNLLSRYVAMQGEYGAERQSSKRDGTDRAQQGQTPEQKAQLSERQREQRLDR